MLMGQSMAVGKRWEEPTGNMQIPVDIWEVTLLVQTLTANIANRMEYSKKMGLDGKLSNSFPLFCLSYQCLDRVREACGDPQMDHNPTSQVLPAFTLFCRTWLHGLHALLPMVLDVTLGINCYLHMFCKWLKLLE